ncbi:nucleotidyltransferase domain-containing protein [Allokutzneria sp. A3M-2-11 16]|uniref:nucleotidyltransferase domain-containing protein n=1 Tax=Allokutzneria sp. A3M-2-11 16 TaxID=2962043 RepID=UPI0020B7637B|nr:nucleotidyltransferase domain-containing protein [Allokutzneria sp. A3M-2-11 16]MCP3798308.1 nucleotidyltransferase domain-containing protein [Allokutzneria sp. A3M-2-11 16]
MIDAAARAVALRFLATLDEAAQGLVTGLHVVGSAVLDDYRAGHSDLDVVVELSRPADLAVLAAAHTGPGVEVEALYVREGELNGRVEDVAAGPWANLGAVTTTERSFQLNPVTWLQLAGPAETLRGPEPKPHVDVEAAKRFCRQNIAEYWAPLLDQAAAAAVLPPTAVEWIALGPPRLWHTVRTGEVVGKSQAGRIAAAHWPDLAAELDDVVAARAGRPRGLTAQHGKAAVELGQRVLHELSGAGGTVS